MSVEYSIKSIKTQTVNGLEKAVQEVVLNIKVTIDGKSMDNFMPVPIPSPNPETFVEYSELDPEKVISWAISVVGQDEINAMINGMTAVLSEKVSSDELVETPLPW